MPAAHPMLADLSATLLALCLWPGLVLVPGYIAAGQWSGWARVAAALPLSFALMPAATYVVARFGSMQAAAGLAAALLVGGVALVVPRLRRPPRWATLAAAVWAVVAYLLMTDIVWDGSLSLTGMANDYAKHVSVAASVARTGVPPVNPSFHPGGPLPLFYYHLWFTLAGVVDLLGGAVVEARHAVYAGVVWTGWALMAMVAMGARRLGYAPAAAVALLAVTGLDLLPFTVVRIAQVLGGSTPAWVPDLEWWNEQVSAWVTAMLWVPHHVAALVACLVGLAALPRRAVWLAGPAFASALGMSIWVTLTAAAIAAVWSVGLAWRRRWGDLATSLAAGGFAILIALPFLLDLAAARIGRGATAALAVREFFPLTRTKELFGVELDCGPLCRLAALPLNYFLEFGFFALAAFAFRRRPQSEDERLLAVAAAVAIVIATFVRSDIAANDLGWRAMMFTQYALLLWSVPAVASLGRRPVLRVAVALGLAATLAQSVSLRLRPFSTEQWELRRTYEWASARLPRDVVVQHDPSPRLEPLHALYGNRQTAAGDRLHAGLYGVPEAMVSAVVEPLAAIFAAPVTATEAAAVARRFGVTHLVAKATDRAWAAPASWVWAAAPLFETKTTRVIAVADLEGR